MQHTVESLEYICEICVTNEAVNGHEIDLIDGCADELIQLFAVRSACSVAGSFIEGCFDEFPGFGAIWEKRGYIRVGLGF